MKSAIVEERTPQSLYQADSLDRQAETFCGKAQWSQAQALLQQSLLLKKQILGEREPSIAFAPDRLGTTLMHGHLTAQATSAFAQAESILESFYYAGHGYLAPVLEHHADCLIAEGKLADAEIVLKRALDIHQNCDDGKSCYFAQHLQASQVIPGGREGYRSSTHSRESDEACRHAARSLC